MIYGYCRWISNENTMISFIIWRRGTWNMISFFCGCMVYILFWFSTVYISLCGVEYFDLVLPKIVATKDKSYNWKCFSHSGIYFILHSLSFLHNIIHFLLVYVTGGFKPIISPSTNSCGMGKWYLSQSSLDWHHYHLLQNVACCRFH